MVHCDTKYNLADMGTKSLNGTNHQFLLQNQEFPPVLSAGECQTDMSGLTTTGKAKLVLSVLTPLDVEIADTLSSVHFQRKLQKGIKDKN